VAGWFKSFRYGGLTGNLPIAIVFSNGLELKALVPEELLLVQARAPGLQEDPPPPPIALKDVAALHLDAAGDLEFDSGDGAGLVGRDAVRLGENAQRTDVLRT
jgi:hypothetical protein